MFREILPNISSLIIVNLILRLAGNIGIETGLTYLGFGLPYTTPSLGTLISAAKTQDIIENKNVGMVTCNNFNLSNDVMYQLHWTSIPTCSGCSPTSRLRNINRLLYYSSKGRQQTFGFMPPKL